MTDKQQGTLDAIELAAGLEARRVAQAAVNAAVQAQLLPERGYRVTVDVSIAHQPVAALAAAGGAS